ncbi:MAG: hypothetical protein KJ621_05100 [Proteobacteria bacterium]|nr:hypothetical protein [Pseudomonadota bacterium]
MPAAATPSLAPQPRLENLPYAVLATIRDPVQVIDRNYRILWCNTFTAEGQVWRAQDKAQSVRDTYFTASGRCRPRTDQMSGPDRRRPG